MSTTYARVNRCRVMIKWYTASSYSDEAAYLDSFSGQMRLNPPFTTVLANRGIVDQIGIILNNKGHRYSSLLPSSDLYSETSEGIWYQSRVYVEVSVDDGATYYRIFTGVIKDMSESTMTEKEVGQVIFDCRSSEELLLNQKLTTTYADFVNSHNGNETESDILARWLGAAGVSSSDYSLDDGLFCIPWAALKDESPVENGWDLASACGGRFYMDHQSGKFIYENATSILGKSVVTSIDRSMYAALRVKYPDVNLFKKVTVKIYDSTVGPADTVFSLDKPIQVAPGATEVHEYDLDNPVTNYIALSYKASTTGGKDISSDVTITGAYYAQKLSLSIANANSAAAYVRLLKHTGQALGTTSDASAKKISANSFWDHVTSRERTIDNKYVQARAQAASLADMLITSGETMLQALEIGDYLGNPLLTLGNIVSVLDDKIMSSSKDYVVTALNFRFSDIGFRQTLELVELDRLVPYYGGISPNDYATFDSTKYGDVGAGIGRLFF
ncbi:MAG: hypothetical protein U0350_36415 [Caldilineaceae bacterium]